MKKEQTYNDQEPSLLNKAVFYGVIGATVVASAVGIHSRLDNDRTFHTGPVNTELPVMTDEPGSTDGMPPMPEDE